MSKHIPRWETDHRTSEFVHAAYRAVAVSHLRDKCFGCVNRTPKYFAAVSHINRNQIDESNIGNMFLQWDFDRTTSTPITSCECRIKFRDLFLIVQSARQTSKSSNLNVMMILLLRTEKVWDRTISHTQNNTNQITNESGWDWVSLRAWTLTIHPSFPKQKKQTDTWTSGRPHKCSRLLC